MAGSPPPPAIELLLILVAVQVLVLLEILAGILQVFGILGSVDVAEGARLFRLRCVFLLAVRGRRANLESAQHYHGRGNDFQSGHLASSEQGSNSITTR